MMIEVPPRFVIATPDEVGTPPACDGARTIVVVPSRAFGDGRHETTRMCLQAIAAFAPRTPFRMLDVGSGTGVLAIAAVKVGAEAAVGVEIDPDANETARENARRSKVEGRVAFGARFPEGPFEMVVANILRDVLLALADDVVARLAPGGVLVLSGLVSTDVPHVTACYAPRLGHARPEVFERGVWRTLVWRASPFARGAARD